MLGRYFKKEKPRVFLGVLAVAPRSRFEQYFDGASLYGEADVDFVLRRSLTEIFALAPVDSVETHLITDLVLDVVIPTFQSGEFSYGSFDGMGLPIFWRPKVTVASRLYLLTTKKTIATFSITEKMSWGQYLARIFSWRAIFSFRSTFDNKDSEYLLYQACIKLLVKMKKVI